MKTVVFENIYNKEKFTCSGKSLQEVKLIDGIEYIRVFKFGTQREVLIRKDSLKKINDKKLKLK